jgi:hypothetical protein
MKNDYLLGSRRWHLLALLSIWLVALFLRAYRLDNCTLCSGDEWLPIGPTFQFLDKFFRNPVTAIGFEAAAGFPFSAVGRKGPPFDYTRSLVLVWTFPYYALVSLFDFPVSESWYRAPGVLWSLLGLWASGFFVYQLTERRVAALFALALQAGLLAHLVQSRFLVADGVFLFWFPLAAGLWLKYLREGEKRWRFWAYLCTMFYASSTPEAFIGLAALFSLLVFWLWTASRLNPLRPWAALKTLVGVFIAPSGLWLLGFYGFQVLVELKLYWHDRANFLNHANYLGRFFGRGTGELGFFVERVFDWYLYPHISAPLLVASALSLLAVRQKAWRPALLYGWLWAAFWVTLTLFVSNSSSNFTRALHPFLVLGVAGVTTVYDRWPRGGTALIGLLFVANLYTVWFYPLFCPAHEDRNPAQAAGYYAQHYQDVWGGMDAVAFYFPTGSLYAYVPEENAWREPRFVGVDSPTACADTLIPETLDGVNVILSLPSDAPLPPLFNKVLDYAVNYPCEAQRVAAVEAFARAQGFSLVGEITSERTGEVGLHIWTRGVPAPELISLEAANQRHYQDYSRRSWFTP